jgi:NADH dehydrogenase FAD-containing subunit
VLNARGQIKIERTFQLPSHRTIYAIGDVIDWEEQKQAIKAPKHAQIAAANILAQLGGGTPKKIYSGQPENIIISNGKVGRSAHFSHRPLSDVSRRLAEAGRQLHGLARRRYTRQLVF